LRLPQAKYRRNSPSNRFKALGATATVSYVEMPYTAIDIVTSVRYDWVCGAALTPAERFSVVAPYGTWGRLADFASVKTPLRGVQTPSARLEFRDESRRARESWRTVVNIAG
jgi:hypothetical protein